MKKKLLLIIPAVIILIVSITLVLTKKTDNQKQILQDNKVEESSKIEDVSTTNENKEETIVEEQEEVKQEEKQEIKNIEQKQITNNTTKETKVQEQPKTETVQPAPVQTQPVQQTQPEPVREQTEWEKLGISEYDYYNSPMWSWARVDYSVKKYGSLEATHQACVDAGNQMEDITSFTCNNINSYSGDYLGEMLKVRY